MTETAMLTLGIIGILFLSFIPVNSKVGEDLSKVLGLYALGFGFRGLFILGAFFNGARIEVLIGIMVSVVLEVTILARIGLEESRKEILA